MNHFFVFNEQGELQLIKEDLSIDAAISNAKSYCERVKQVKYHQVKWRVVELESLTQDDILAIIKAQENWGDGKVSSAMAIQDMHKYRVVKAKNGSLKMRIG